MTRETFQNITLVVAALGFIINGIVFYMDWRRNRRRVQAQARAIISNDEWARNAMAGVIETVKGDSMRDDGTRRFFFFPEAQNTGDVTVQWKGQKAQTLKKKDGSPMQAGDIAAGSVVVMDIETMTGEAKNRKARRVAKSSKGVR